MSVFDTFKFWKKKEPNFDMPTEFSAPPEFKTDDFAQNRPFPSFNEEPAVKEHDFSQFERPAFKEREPERYVEKSSNSRDTELILAKLDAIKANIENINQRLANLEKIAERPY